MQSVERKKEKERERAECSFVVLPRQIYPCFLAGFTTQDKGLKAVQSVQECLQLHS